MPMADKKVSNWHHMKCKQFAVSRKLLALITSRRRSVYKQKLARNAMGTILVRLAAAKLFMSSGKAKKSEIQTKKELEDKNQRT